MLNWNDVRYFLAIHRARSLAGAARDLKVDQTTVGRRLAALEDALGAKLFERTTDGLAITTAGERALAFAADFDERFGTLEARVRESSERAEGTVRVATSENLAVDFLVPRLVSVRAKHPELEIELVTSSARVNLLRREADIAIRATSAAPAQQDVIARKVADAAFGVFATRAYLDAHGPLRIDAGLDGHDVVAYDEEIAPTPPGRWITETATAARQVVRVNSLICAANAAAEGAGLALLPCFIASRYPSLVRALPGTPLSVGLWVLVHPDLQRTARIRAVIDHIAATMKEAEPILSGHAIAER